MHLVQQKNCLSYQRTGNELNLKRNKNKIADFNSFALEIDAKNFPLKTVKDGDEINIFLLEKNGQSVSIFASFVKKTLVI